MSSFDYETAWYEVAAPAYAELPQSIKDVVLLLKEKYSDLRQMHDLHVPIPDDVAEALRGFTSVELMTFADVVYNYGNWMPFGYASSGTEDEKRMLAAEAEKHPISGSGAYWKFKDIATQLAYSDGRHVGHSEELHRLKLRHDRAADRFMCSEKMQHWLRDCRIAAYYGRPAPARPTPDLDKDDEVYEAVLAAWPKGVGTPVEVRRVNHRLKDGILPVLHGASASGPFMITARHLRGSEDRYLDPNCAPCGRTGNAYSDFTSDRVLVVKFENGASDDDVKAQLLAAGPLLTTYRIDGYVLTKG